MARIVSAYLLILYTAFTTGLVVDVHYCAGKISSITFETTRDKDGCGKCETKKKSCCHDDLKILKVNDSHSAAFASSVPECPQTILQDNFYFANVLMNDNLPQTEKANHSPPLKTPPDIFTRNCVFRI